MNQFMIVLIIIGALATAAVLIRGIILMASGKDVTGKQSNKLMSYRVGLQALTIVFVIILLMLMRNGN